MFELVANVFGWGGIALLLCGGPVVPAVVMMAAGFLMALHVLWWGAHE